MINEFFPATEFRDSYIHCQPDVLSMSALLSTVYMSVQDSTVHILPGGREHSATEISEYQRQLFVSMSVSRDP